MRLAGNFGDAFTARRFVMWRCTIGDNDAGMSIAVPGNRRKFPVSELHITGRQIDDRRLMRIPGLVGIGWLARHASGGLARCVAWRAVMARQEMK